MSKNPINLATISAGVIKKKYTKLYDSHKKLIATSVTIENKLIDIQEAVAVQCNSCVLKSTEPCTDCPLHTVATEQKLWREL